MGRSEPPGNTDPRSERLSHRDVAWPLRRWKKWSDKRGNLEEAFPRDFILTQATIFWVTQAHMKGGHFVHYENPEAFTSDLVETFRRIGG